MCGLLGKDLQTRLVKCYIRSVLPYGAETWALRKVDTRRLEAMGIWLWRKIESISWEDRITNKEVLRKVGEERQMIEGLQKRKQNLLGHTMKREYC